ncbi:hypothetical protein QBC44DRAFT_385008 [Cladorrhinum sp. PSN332]|nr:hypothetical protein QBC44DRAFT_385008 [Cladorrhinum sp. PSN332]
MDSPVVDYTQGFGSFDFFPRAFPDFVPRYVSSQQRIPPKTTTSSTQIKPFPFMSLPPEIRRQIYRILLARLFPGRHLHLHKDAIGNGIRFVLNDTPYSPGRVEVDYGLRVAGRPEDRTVDDRASTDDIFYRRHVLETYKAIRAVEDKCGANSGDGHDYNNGHHDHVDGGQFQVPGGWISTTRFLQFNDVTCSGEEEEEAQDSDSDSRSEVESDMDGKPPWEDPVSVTISRAMDPDPQCSPRWHEPDADYYLLEKSAGPYRRPEPDDYNSVTWEAIRDMDGCTCSYRTPDDYYTVLELSKVSPQFTAELGSVLWANSTIEILEPAVFGMFARTRPAALSFVRGVVLHVACEGNFCDTEIEAVREVCDFFNFSSARLNFFTVVLSMRKSTTSGPITLAGTGTDQKVYNFCATAEARIKELAPVFRALEMSRGASFQVRFGQGLLRWQFHIWNDQGLDSDLRAAMERAPGEIRQAWLPACIRENEEARDAGLNIRGRE